MFHQLLTLVGISQDHGFPVAFALMTRRTRDIYRITLRRIRQELPRECLCRRLKAMQPGLHGLIVGPEARNPPGSLVRCAMALPANLVLQGAEDQANRATSYANPGINWSTVYEYLCRCRHTLDGIPVLVAGAAQVPEGLLLPPEAVGEQVPALVATVAAPRGPQELPQLEQAAAAAVQGGLLQDHKSYLCLKQKKLLVLLLLLLLQFQVDNNYDIANHQDFQHVTAHQTLQCVNHDTDPPTHTIIVEGMWRHAMSKLPEYNRKKESFVRDLVYHHASSPLQTNYEKCIPEMNRFLVDHKINSVGCEARMEVTWTKLELSSTIYFERSSAMTYLYGTLFAPSPIGQKLLVRTKQQGGSPGIEELLAAMLAAVYTEDIATFSWVGELKTRLGIEEVSLFQMKKTSLEVLNGLFFETEADDTVAKLEKEGHLIIDPSQYWVESSKVDL
ncbi:unnamed protein product [Darwinula stevensoni]|uniref:Uncharacterized protein n=1 Tax=Darwinula stevensoni TaxID=69355 RepID=A0A7R8XG24_9CRUS|nr:unnamed protein product [Darwinula stevensoni]CAG0895889.1 unnamed protein product [Darwinula stevensoni]